MALVGASPRTAVLRPQRQTRPHPCHSLASSDLTAPPQVGLCVCAQSQPIFDTQLNTPTCSSIPVQTPGRLWLLKASTLKSATGVAASTSAWRSSNSGQSAKPSEYLNKHFVFAAQGNIPLADGWRQEWWQVSVDRQSCQAASALADLVHLCGCDACNPWLTPGCDCRYRVDGVYLWALASWDVQVRSPGPCLASPAGTTVLSTLVWQS